MSEEIKITIGQPKKTVVKVNYKSDGLTIKPSINTGISNYYTESGIIDSNEINLKGLAKFIIYFEVNGMIQIEETNYDVSIVNSKTTLTFTHQHEGAKYIIGYFI